MFHEAVSARPRDTANDDNGDGSDGDKDPTTLTSATTDALCEASSSQPRLD